MKQFQTHLEGLQWPTVLTMEEFKLYSYLLPNSDLVYNKLTTTSPLTKAWATKETQMHAFTGSRPTAYLSLLKESEEMLTQPTKPVSVYTMRWNGI